MKITKVMVNRKFNMGNYETLDLAAEAELSEKDNPLETWEIIRDNIEMEFQAMQRKDRNASSKPVEQPPANPFKKAEPASEAKPSSLKPENKCPNCGKWKDSRYPVCYVCHEAEKAQ